jgi:hypothetical protein
MGHLRRDLSNPGEKGEDEQGLWQGKPGRGQKPKAQAQLCFLEVLGWAGLGLVGLGWAGPGWASDAMRQTIKLLPVGRRHWSRGSEFPKSDSICSLTCILCSCPAL